MCFLDLMLFVEDLRVWKKKNEGEKNLGRRFITWQSGVTIAIDYHGEPI